MIELQIQADGIESVIAKVSILATVLFEDIKKYLRTITYNEAERIKYRTSIGVDYTGAAFTPYSKQWADVRSKSGLETNKVNLFFTGGMLSGMLIGNVDDSATKLYFSSSYENIGARTRQKIGKINTRTIKIRKGVKNAASIAYAHKFGSGNLPIRDFFAVSPDDIKDITDEVMAVISTTISALFA